MNSCESGNEEWDEAMNERAERPKHTNRLVDATSPYLLQHAHNPVDWYPWGEEALARAKAEDRLILLSIGYSACHWCHVMERESFEDEVIAGLMNEHFVNIKVDREERPDLDEIYMAATVAMNRGQGGWPMTVFLTPELEPLFAGTYFPPSDMYGRPGFPTVIKEIARAWREDREALRRRAAEFVEHMKQQKTLRPPLAVGLSELRGALQSYKQDFDPQYGGFGSAPKFPPAVGLSLLLRLHRRFGDSQALVMVRRTLEGMARGGMYDHVGGGFARYSTDSRWLVPHFEKMLYDNALLTKAYLDGHQATGDAFFARVAAETLDYVLREMTAPDGGFYSSTDADSEGVEGKFFVWTPEQIAQILDDEESRSFCAYYDITLTGNWEGVSIPNAPRPSSDVAEELGVTPEVLEETLERARAKVYTARQRRVKPGLDDKILTAWNGLMIGAFAEGYRVLGDARYLEAAERAADFVLRELSREDGSLLRTCRAGKAHLQAYLEDYAYLGAGLIDLYEAGGSLRWLREAERLLERALADFLDPESGAFFNTANDHEELIIRNQDGTDGATPSGNAVAAWALARLSYHLDRPELRNAAIAAIKAFGQMIAQYPRGFAQTLCIVDLLLDGPVELAFVGQRGSEDLEALQREVAVHYLPNRIQALLDPDAPDGADRLPLLTGKGLVDGQAALYVCRAFACQPPVTDPAAVRLQLERAKSGGTGESTIAVRLPGLATGAGTARYAARFSDNEFANFGPTALAASRLGFGGYRVHDRDPDHREALRRALSAGINVLDTSTNYTDGASERLVGAVLRGLVDAGELFRDEVIVVSKVGYLQGTNLESAKEREKGGHPFPEVVKYEDGLWHCIHPEFLDEQLDRSLDRLELDSLDIYLLHNPEYFLSDAARRGKPLDSARDEFYRRLEAAFSHLERRVAEGRLAGYGVSSNSVVAPASAADATSLSRMLAAARKAGGDAHHFRVLQLPLNLLEAGAVFERDADDGGRTVLDVARAEDIAVLVNRPLNAFVSGSLIRLADAAIEEDATSPFDEQLGRLADLEFSFHAEIAPQLGGPDGSGGPSDIFRFAESLSRMQQATFSVAHWSQIEAQINHGVRMLVAALESRLEGEIADAWAAWRDAYLAELDDLLRRLRAQATRISAAQAAALHAAIDPLLPAERRSESLSRKALWTVASTPGITCVLNGMRRVDYVDDSAAVMGWEALDAVERIYAAANTAFNQLKESD
ncbi:MAG: aldo/keto reductase [Gemmatimonadales bacterium]